jgi:hypothetical protein
MALSMTNLASGFTMGRSLSAASEVLVSADDTATATTRQDREASSTAQFGRRRCTSQKAVASGMTPRTPKIAASYHPQPKAISSVIPTTTD